MIYDLNQLFITYWMTKVEKTFEDKIKVADMQKDMISEAMEVTI